eukprot:TRINITY_DN2841_c0_g1_i1.p1 TRINITY_DN2841_c0_g1~~TRINITY_DN2841_c0_g1_i1.p1  ORF type:complete len:334 (-),score=4.27 TRINITY_DN2841_c0_g1_i1:549-1550(-)
MIMYILITGKHPIYQSGDELDKYLAKIKAPEWKFPESFSELAKEFFLKLVKGNPLERYTAKEALAHPWITRTPGKIPLSYTETISYENSKVKLVNVLFSFSRQSEQQQAFMCCFFVAEMGAEARHFEIDSDDPYQEKLERVSDRVSKWYQEQFGDLAGSCFCSSKYGIEQIEKDSDLYEKLLAVPQFPEEIKFGTRSQNSAEMCRVSLFIKEKESNGSLGISPDSDSPNSRSIDLRHMSGRVIFRGSACSASPTRGTRRTVSNQISPSYNTAHKSPANEPFRPIAYFSCQLCQSYIGRLAIMGTEPRCLKEITRKLLKSVHVRTRCRLPRSHR